MKKSVYYTPLQNSSSVEKFFQNFLVFLLFVVVAFTDKPGVKIAEQTISSEVKSDIIKLTNWKNDQFSGIISLHRIHLKEIE